MTAAAPSPHSYWQGQLCYDHPWFKPYLDQLAHKIVLELPQGLLKLTYWLSNPMIVPNSPIRISAIEGRILAVNGTTRLAAALLLPAAWPVILEARNSSSHWDLLEKPKPMRAQPILAARIVGWPNRTRLMLEAEHTLMQVNLDTSLSPLDQILSLNRALNPNCREAVQRKNLTPS